MKIDALWVAIRRTETRIAMRRSRLVRIHPNVTLSSLKRVCKLIPFRARQKLSLGMGWGWNKESE